MAIMKVCDVRETETSLNSTFAHSAIRFFSEEKALTLKYKAKTSAAELLGYFETFGS